MGLLTGTENQTSIRTAQVCGTDVREVAREFHARVNQPDIALVLFFCSSEFDLDALAEELRRLFAGVLVAGCTTAGEIGPGGYQEHSLAGVSFARSEFHAVSCCVERLQGFEIDRGRAAAEALRERLESEAPQATPENSFAVLLIDGLSGREEPVTRALQAALGKYPMVGGSAGDGVKFGKTKVFLDGAFHADSAVLVLVTTPLPFRTFKTQHFVATDQRLVVTDADPLHRIVKEMDGLPAALEYARLLHVETEALDPLRFAASPVVVMIDGTNYVRSIQKVNPDGSLTFFCAIEAGLVLRLARGVNILENLEEAFAKIRAEIGPPQFVLGCDCILRKLEIVGKHLDKKVGDILARNNVVGFNTYGEQFQGVHVNQTLVGIAIGRASSASRDA